MTWPGKLGYEQRVRALLALGALPTLLLSGLALSLAQAPAWLYPTLLIPLAALLLLWLRVTQRRIVRPLQTMANLLLALREGDFSARAHVSGGSDALAETLTELNALGEALHAQRLTAVEAMAFLRRVMEEIDVAVLAFDSEARVRLANRSAERALGQPVERLLGQSAAALGLVRLLDGDVPRIEEIDFPCEPGRYEVRRATIRQGGIEHRLLVLADMSRALREEERQAWRRLIRVLTHELNNSLTPIKSVAGSLATQLTRTPRADDWDQDAQRGLAVIGARAEALARFIEGYSQLARLPAPKLRAVPLRPLVERAVRCETRVAVAVAPGPDLAVMADPDQIEQALINLLRNASEAASETQGGVRLTWRRSADVAPAVDIFVVDDGPGLRGTENLFVPFFTTKPSGTGIGLVLSRQIAEAHGGSLTLADRKDAHGCRAHLRLRLSA